MAGGKTKLSLVLGAVDKVSAPIRKINRRVESMTKPIRKVKNAFKSLARESKLGKLARSIGRVGKSIGKAFTGKAALAISAVGTLVGGRFLKGGVESAAAYEKLGVRLKVLTGNAEGARQVLEGVDKLATKTPFSLEELGNTAASMSVIFKGSTEHVSEFTALASDLAAAYGKPVEQIGENLQRAFSAGLGSADVLREAGISAEILKITGASKASEVSQRDLAAALRKMAAEGGPAFNAAAEQAATLDGTLSNTGIAFGNLQRASGQALAPVISSIANGRLIPLFERLQSLVESNSDRISGALFSAIDRLKGIWDSLSEGFTKGFEAIRGVDTGSGSLADTFDRVSEVVSSLFEKMGGWETVGAVIGGAVGVSVSYLETLWGWIAKILELVDSFTPEISAAFDKLATVGSGVAGFFGFGGGDNAAPPPGASNANVGGRISIELDDRRARVKSAESAAPGVELDLAGGEALAPA